MTDAGWRIPAETKRGRARKLVRGPGVCTGSDEQILAWADETERGYGLADLPAPRRGVLRWGRGLVSL